MDFKVGIESIPAQFATLFDRCYDGGVAFYRALGYSVERRVSMG